MIALFAFEILTVCTYKMTYMSRILYTYILAYTERFGLPIRSYESYGCPLTCILCLYMSISIYMSIYILIYHAARRPGTPGRTSSS